MRNYFSPGNVIDAKTVNYPFALDLMERIVGIKRKKKWPEILLLLEHPPVITLGKSATFDDVLCNADVLTANGITVHRVQRGGLATYHGPGQLVGYLLMDLRRHDTRPGQLVDHIENAIIEALARYRIDARQRNGHRGVWVGVQKAASIGIAVRGGISYHGFALNCCPHLPHFDFISPCGFQSSVMTSMTRLLGASITPDEMKPILSFCLGKQIGIEFSTGSFKKLVKEVYSEQHVPVAV